MNARVSYSSNALVGTNKAGILKPDENGYYTVVLGGVNTCNSIGAFYRPDGVDDLVNKSSSLMRRIEQANLNGERGHPKRLPGMSDQDYLMRVRTIYEDNISHHIAEVWLDKTSFIDPATGKNIIAFMGKVKPDGSNHGNALKSSLENPKQNTCFSIRSFTKDQFVGGKLHKVLKEVITWDWVNEPGIAIANKYSNPSLESFDETSFSQRQVMEIANIQNKGLGLECGVIPINDLINAFGWNHNHSVPLSMKLK